MRLRESNTIEGRIYGAATLSFPAIPHPASVVRCVKDTRWDAEREQEGGKSIYHFSSLAGCSLESYRRLQKKQGNLPVTPARSEEI